MANAVYESGQGMPSVIMENSDMPPMPAKMLMGMNTTLNTVSWLMRLFWLMLMKPMVASIKKLILSNKNAVWLLSDSMLRNI